LRERLKAIAMRTNVEVIDPLDFLCSENRCQVAAADGTPFYRDTGHMRPFYVRANATYIDRVLEPTP
jgi:hypothetical protein